MCDSWSRGDAARTLRSMASAHGVRDRLEELLSERILVLDGAMGTAIQSLELSEEEFRGDRLREHARDLRGDVDVLNLTRPHVVEEIHRGYLDAGADIVPRTPSRRPRSPSPTIS